MRLGRCLLVLGIVASLAGCANQGGTVAGASAGAVRRDWRPDVIVVQKGDTLYSIAFNYGMDYHDLADLNGIKDPSVISIGQEIHLFPPKASPASASAAPEVKPYDTLVKDQPKLVKYIYSDAAMTQIDKVQEGHYTPPDTTVAATSRPVTAPATTVSTASADATPDDDGSSLGWMMPAQGKLITRFSEADNRKGIDIAGKLGQPVFASAAGKVVYSGSGLRGYGKLIIIKHNSTYLSAYAHNDQILVKEGQTVTRGQKIAEMGNTDTNQVELHFEVRKLGKPVDPARYLPIDKS